MNTKHRALSLIAALLLALLTAVGMVACTETPDTGTETTDAAEITTEADVVDTEAPTEAPT